MTKSVKLPHYTSCPLFLQYPTHHQVLLVLLHVACLFTSLHLLCYKLVQAAIIFGVDYYYRSLLTGLTLSILAPSREILKKQARPCHPLIETFSSFSLCLEYNSNSVPYCNVKILPTCMPSFSTLACFLVEHNSWWLPQGLSLLYLPFLWFSNFSFNLKSNITLAKRPFLIPQLKFLLSPFIF